MDPKELRDLSVEDLTQKERELKKELLNLRFQSGTGRVENPSRLRQARREIAQVKTVHREKRGSSSAPQKAANEKAGN